MQNLEDDKPFYFQAQTSDTHHIWGRDFFIRKNDPHWAKYPKIDKSKIKTTPGWGDALKPEGALLDKVAEYYGAIQRVDWFVGRILQLLKKHKHAHNTLIVFSSDHGPSHLLRGKTTPGESGLHVPFIVRWNEKIQTPGIRSNALVSFVDLYPSFLEAAGLKERMHLPGHSFIPVLEGKLSSRMNLYSAYITHTTADHLYWPTRTINDGRYKLIHHLFGNGKKQRYKGKNSALAALNKQINGMEKNSISKKLRDQSHVPSEFEFYDLQEDPHEQNNYFGKTKNSFKQEKLKKRLLKWQENSSDPFLDSDYVKRFSEVYHKNIEIIKSNSTISNKNPLDFEEFIPAWDASPYLGSKDL